MSAVLPALDPASVLERRLPEWLEVRWWHDPEAMVALAPQAEIGWFDLHEKTAGARSHANGDAISNGSTRPMPGSTGCRWPILKERGVTADLRRRD